MVLNYGTMLCLFCFRPYGSVWYMLRKKAVHISSSFLRVLRRLQVHTNSSNCLGFVWKIWSAPLPLRRLRWRVLGNHRNSPPVGSCRYQGVATKQRFKNWGPPPSALGFINLICVYFCISLPESMPFHPCHVVSFSQPQRCMGCTPAH